MATILTSDTMTIIITTPIHHDLDHDHYPDIGQLQLMEQGVLDSSHNIYVGRVSIIII